MRQVFLRKNLTLRYSEKRETEHARSTAAKEGGGDYERYE